MSLYVLVLKAIKHRPCNSPTKLTETINAAHRTSYKLLSVKSALTRLKKSGYLLHDATAARNKRTYRLSPAGKRFLASGKPFYTVARSESGFKPLPLRKRAA